MATATRDWRRRALSGRRTGAWQRFTAGHRAPRDEQIGTVLTFFQMAAHHDVCCPSVSNLKLGAVQLPTRYLRRSTSPFTVTRQSFAALLALAAGAAYAIAGSTDASFAAGVGRYAFNFNNSAAQAKPWPCNGTAKSSSSAVAITASTATSALPPDCQRRTRYHFRRTAGQRWRQVPAADRRWQRRRRRRGRTT